MKKTKVVLLAAMQKNVSELIEVAILISSVSDIPNYTAIFAPFKTMKSDDITWDYVTGYSIEPQRGRGQPELRGQYRRQIRRWSQCP